MAGRQGPQGNTGAQGAQGPQGSQGPQGFQASNVFLGPQGFQGVAGSIPSSITALGVNTPAGPTGTVRATDDITAYFSDIRLKDNIQTIADAAEKLYTLNGIFYRQNEIAKKYGYNDYKKQVGVLAQEIQKIMPEAVKMAPFDTDEYGNSKSGMHYLTVQYEKLLPLIIQTIKEQQLEIENLQGLIDNG